MLDLETATMIGRFLSQAYGIQTIAHESPCAFCRDPNTAGNPAQNIHAGPDMGDKHRRSRIVVVVLDADNSVPRPVCRDCARALMSLALDLGF